MLFAYRSKPELESYAATDRLMTRGFRTARRRRLDGDELVALEPALKPGLAGGWYYERRRPPPAGQADESLAAGPRGRRRRDPRRIVRFEGFAADATAGATSALTEQGELTADVFIVATGAWTPLLNQHARLPHPDPAGEGLQPDDAPARRLPRRSP